MAKENALAQFLEAAANRYATHDSAIAAHLSRTLLKLRKAAVVEEPASSEVATYLPHFISGSEDPLLRCLGKIAGILHWRVPGRGRIPVSLAEKMAAVEIVGPTGMIATTHCRFGLFVQAPNLFYPEHCHEAEELYLILGGNALWGTDDIPERPVPPGTFIRHASWQPHTMRTITEPLLAMWCWTGNIDFETYTMGSEPRLST